MSDAPLEPASWIAVIFLVLLAMGLIRGIRSWRDGRHLITWGFIFAGAFAISVLWEDRSRSLIGGFETSQSGEIIVPRARDGHYYLTVQVNDAPIRFMVDTGATQIVLTPEDAAAAGLDVDSLAFIGRAMTANGEVAIAPVRLDRMVLDGIEDSRIRASVNGGEMDQSLLGMSYLGLFESIEIRANQLILRR